MPATKQQAALHFYDLAAYLHAALLTADADTVQDCGRFLTDYAKQYPRSIRNLQRIPAARMLLDAIEQASAEFSRTKRPPRGRARTKQ